MSAFEGLSNRAVAIHKRYLNRERIGDPGSDEDRRFLALATAGEAGELANLVKKEWRGNPPSPEAIRKEIGDVLNYLVLFAWAAGVDPVEAAADALDEYESRFHV